MLVSAETGCRRAPLFHTNPYTTFMHHYKDVLTNLNPKLTEAKSTHLTYVGKHTLYKSQR